MYSKKLCKAIARYWNWAKVEYNNNGVLLRCLHGSESWEPVLTIQIREAIRYLKYPY